jgi:hypothetical protein
MSMLEDHPDVLPDQLASMRAMDVIRAAFRQLSAPRDAVSAEIDALVALQLVSVLAARVIDLQDELLARPVDGTRQ